LSSSHNKPSNAISRADQREARYRFRGYAPLNLLITTILAPRCAACARPLETPLDGPVCPACWAAVHPGGEYEGSLRDIIQAFKYEGRRSLAAPLAALMRVRGADLLRDATCVVPVPLHAFRRVQRGFNQASDLARHLERPVVHALWRTRYTMPQTGLSGAERRRNVRRAFRLSPLLSAMARATFIEGRIVVVIDDVRTTGATLAACTRVLKEAGAREVRVLTLARARLDDAASMNAALSDVSSSSSRGHGSIPLGSGPESRVVRASNPIRMLAARLGGGTRGAS
jgi:ComF family protein